MFPIDEKLFKSVNVSPSREKLFQSFFFVLPHQVTKDLTVGIRGNPAKSFQAINTYQSQAFVVEIGRRRKRKPRLANPACANTKAEPGG